MIVTLSLELLPLDVRDKEGSDEVLNEDLGLVPSFFDLVDELVECVGFELGL